MSSTYDHGHQEMLDGLPPATDTSFRPLIGPLISRGLLQVEKYRFYPLSARQMFAFNTLARLAFGALTCTLRLDAVEDVVGHSNTHSILYGTKKGCKPCQKACRRLCMPEVLGVY
ncbi:hypothetical protein TNIN_270431 [Trichonephila inaurata madagascariensis]|uniref:Uncharacterized protein n=1 Tax=Trichonephila inaurata madagascariensis TaxID=2747483 RepID=A0A8X7BZH9_9ARAC|nr:hypothetical protein TNIN_270431 [Trichonephila inaurata madagascariensis]